MVQIQHIQQKIRNDIVAGELPFGARVTIAGLAERYGVSQMPIREALQALHGEGLLVIEPNRGARVRTVDREFIGNIFDIREALEVLLIRKMVRRASDSDVAALREIQVRLEHCITTADYQSALPINWEFHTRINTVAANPDAVALLERHWLLVAALWQRYDFGPERFGGEINDHRHLIEAITRRDSDAAASLMSAHVIKARFILLARMAQDEAQNGPAAETSAKRRRARSAADQAAH